MFGIKKFTLKTTKFAEPKDLDDNNSLTKFLNTLSKEEKDGEFLKLSSAKQINYVQAMAAFQIEAMGDIGEASIKALTMWAMKLCKSNIDEFEFSQSFYGTKENLKEEVFTIKLTKLNEIEDTKQNVEFGNNLKSPRKKSESFLNQPDMILDIIEKLADRFPKEEQNRLPLRASGLLLVAEFMSQCNMQDLSATLEGLMDGDTPLNASYKVEAIRKEIGLDLVVEPKKRRFF
jgi:hypothetical protein